MTCDDVLDTFQCPGPVQAYERTGARAANGGWASPKGAVRDVKDAVVLQADPVKLQALTQGDIAGGGIVIHTRETLYFQGATATGTENRQSFILYNGFVFRVIASGFMAANTGFNTYTAVRYIDNDSDDGNNP
jgi:hypothetical protein